MFFCRLDELLATCTRVEYKGHPLAPRFYCMVKVINHIILAMAHASVFHLIHIKMIDRVCEIPWVNLVSPQIE